MNVGRAVHEDEELDDALDALEVAEGGVQRAQEVDGDAAGRLASLLGRERRAELADPRLAVPLRDVAGHEEEVARPARSGT